MDINYDSDFDLLLDDLRDVTSGEDWSSSSSSVSSSSSPINIPFKKEVSKKPKIKQEVEDDGSIDSSEVQHAKVKILRYDIRRSYGNMFLNVMNSTDFSLIYGFLDTFFVPNMQNVFTRPNCGSTPDSYYTNPRITLKQSGVHDVAKYWYASVLMKPDAIVTMKSCNVVTPINSNESKIVSRFNFKATLFLEDMPPEFSNPPSESGLVCAEAERVVGKKRSKDAESTKKSEELKSLMSTVDNMVCNLSIRSDPVLIDADGELTMFLDENKRVTKMVMDCVPAPRK